MQQEKECPYQAGTIRKFMFQQVGIDEESDWARGRLDKKFYNRMQNSIPINEGFVVALIYISLFCHAINNRVIIRE